MRGVIASALLLCLLAPASSPLVAQQAALSEGPVLARFADEKAFADYVKKVTDAQSEGVDENAVEANAAEYDLEAGPPAIEPPAAMEAPVYAPAMPVMQNAPPPPEEMGGMAQATTANPEITNNQNRGVDEGGIIKQIGRFLIVLQDGRLFSVDLGKAVGDPLRLAGRTDVYRSERSAADWYDEMLVLGDRILVTAYNYNEEASEITVLRMSPEGKFRREARYLVSSNDYYSTENYATRMVGDNLVFYVPKAITAYGEDGRFAWPRLRRADGDGPANAGEDLIKATDVYAPPGEIDYPVIHMVSVCPLKAGIECRTTAFVGESMREFYVTPTDAYLWVGSAGGMPWHIDYGNADRRADRIAECGDGEMWRSPDGEAALLYRVPLDGGGIGAVEVSGTPDDQFAFDARDGRFRALVSEAKTGCASYEDPGTLKLIDFPLSAFGPRVTRIGASAYTVLPPHGGQQFEKRFLGDWLLYSGRGYEDRPQPGRESAVRTLIAVPLADPSHPRKLAMPHSALRIERAGNGAIITGYRDMQGLSLSYVGLGANPRIASTTMLPGRYESEGRSHAFNAAVGADGNGLMGIPTTRSVWRADRGWSDSESSDLSFLSIAPAGTLTPVGELGVRGRKPARGYRCIVSCVDWYGNSRPVFTQGRVFALMGTELVEGEIRGGRIAELGRVDMTGPVR